MWNKADDLDFRLTLKFIVNKQKKLGSEIMVQKNLPLPLEVKTKMVLQIKFEQS